MVKPPKPFIKAIGAHVSAAGGFDLCFDRARAIGANCFQVFVSSPRMWRVPPVEARVTLPFKTRLKEEKWLESFVHIKYLVNLVSANPDTAQKSVQCIIEELTLAAALGLKGGMFHIGAHQGKDRKEAIKILLHKSQEVLAAIPGDIWFILENSATANKLGASIEEVADIVHQLKHPQVKICLDTAHAFASGYDLRTAPQVTQWVEQVEQQLGWDHVAVLHANDSKGLYQSGVDRHANIGEGEIGLEGFRALINHPKLKTIPFILEVPGYDPQHKGPDKTNIDRLTSLLLAS